MQLFEQTFGLLAVKSDAWQPRICSVYTVLHWIPRFVLRGVKSERLTECARGEKSARRRPT